MKKPVFDFNVHGEANKTLTTTFRNIMTVDGAYGFIPGEDVYEVHITPGSPAELKWRCAIEETPFLEFEYNGWNYKIPVHLIIKPNTARFA